MSFVVFYACYRALWVTTMPFFISESGNCMKGYMKIAEASVLWGISERRINTLCLEGRIKGAEKFGNAWAIPKNTEKPEDKRIKTGKYFNYRKQRQNLSNQ